MGLGMFLTGRSRYCPLREAESGASRATPRRTLALDFLRGTNALAAVQVDDDRVLVRVGNFNLEAANVVGVHVVGILAREADPDESGPLPRALESELELS